jgi:hypothetical protein
MTKKPATSSQLGIPVRLLQLFDNAIENLQRFGPMKRTLFVNDFTRELLDELLRSRDVKIRRSHHGEVVVLNIYKHPKCYETYHTISTLTSSLILRAALEKFCEEGEYTLVSRSSTSAWLLKDGVQTLVLARQFHQKVKSLQLLLDRVKGTKPACVIVVLPKKHKNFFGMIAGYQISILELGSSFAPVHNQRRR